MRYGHPYTRWEDNVIIEEHAKGLNSVQIAERLPGRTDKSVRERALRFGIHFSRGTKKPPERKRDKTKPRTCLVGGHAFNARVNDEGRFLEFSCPDCRLSATKAERSALI